MIKVNGCIVGNECFPNNERIFKTNDFGDKYFDVEFKYETDIDISVLIMVKKFLDDTYNNPIINLIMKYVPYSRMDRKIKGYMFSLKYFCQLINDLHFYSVEVLDTHSNVTTALIERCTEMSVQDNINRIFSNTHVDYVFYPDNGAMKRYSEMLKIPVPYFFGNKKRNLNTGEIIGYELVDCPDIKDKTVLIIDDLCAFGGTFYGASEKLTENGASNVILYISHCENSIYKGKLLKTDLVSKIFTTDSILTDWSSNKIINIESLGE